MQLTVLAVELELSGGKFIFVNSTIFGLGDKIRIHISARARV